MAHHRRLGSSAKAASAAGVHRKHNWQLAMASIGGNIGENIEASSKSWRQWRKRQRKLASAASQRRKHRRRHQPSHHERNRRIHRQRK